MNSRSAPCSPNAVRGYTPAKGGNTLSPSTPTSGAIAARSGSGAKEMILFWVQNRLKEYPIPMTNFSTCWNDGLAFCALIHVFYPEDFDWYALSAENRRYNFTLGFQKAEELAGIYPLLEVDDMVRFVKPDWKCVFTYVQSFYRRFRDGRSPSPRPSTPSTTKLSEVAQAVAAEGDCQKKGEKDERNVTKKLAQAGPKFAEKDQAKPRPPPLMIKKSTSPSSTTSSIQSPGTSTSSRIQSPGTPSWVRTTSPVSSGSPKWIKSSTESSGNSSKSPSLTTQRNSPFSSGVKSPTPSSPGIKSPTPSSPGIKSPTPSSPGIKSPTPSSPGVKSLTPSSPGVKSPTPSSPGIKSPTSSSPGVNTPTPNSAGIKSHSSPFRSHSKSENSEKTETPGGNQDSPQTGEKIYENSPSFEVTPPPEDRKKDTTAREDERLGMENIKKDIPGKRPMPKCQAPILKTIM